MDSNTDWNDERAGKEVFNLFENISTVIEKELEKTKYSEVEKNKKLADFGDLVREKTDSLYCDYLQKRLTPFYEREERRKEHLEAMRKIDPTICVQTRILSLNEINQSQVLVMIFRCSSRTSVYE